MQTIKEWALGLVIVSVFSTVMLILAPSGALEKSVKTAVSIVMLFMFVKPFFNDYKIAEIKLDTEIVTYKNNIDSDKYIADAFRAEIDRNIISLLEREGVINAKTETVVNVNAYDELIVESVKLYIPKQYSKLKDKVCSVIKNELGIIAEAEVVD